MNKDQLILAPMGSQWFDFLNYVKGVYIPEEINQEIQVPIPSALVHQIFHLDFSIAQPLDITIYYLGKPGLCHGIADLPIPHIPSQPWKQVFS